ncbi:hypothetical protein PV664_33895 [Streptomyces sp. ME01-18a]|uniref:hypothetical protein n=1 Tax=Streptomyces sp. ME01-18a TaxID=3028669 RepID=UPI0029BF6475|nr:hypothetical protein [Streptomyces sp. ME01-18a]MDX3433878.1 hypothetical protein [Streptomyces sp. ME01-18a]
MTTPDQTAAQTSVLEIPTFDRSWLPQEITGWLATVEEDEDVSDADLARARKAVSEALGVE